jgi:hypothetical protein
MEGKVDEATTESLFENFTLVLRDLAHGISRTSRESRSADRLGGRGRRRDGDWSTAQEPLRVHQRTAKRGGQLDPAIAVATVEEAGVGQELALGRVGAGVVRRPPSEFGHGRE